MDSGIAEAPDIRQLFSPGRTTFGDPKQAAESRVKMLDMLAANKIAVMSYRYPWSGYGHVVKTGEGFDYIAEPMSVVL